MHFVLQLGAQLDSAIRAVRHEVRMAGVQLAPRERLTLEIGSCLVLSALGLGLQLGRWSASSVLIALGGYLAWVVIYSEATVQASRFRGVGRVRRLAETNSADPTPADEQ